LPNEFQIPQVGLPNVGKSTIANALARRQVSFACLMLLENLAKKQWLYEWHLSDFSHNFTYFVFCFFGVVQRTQVAQTANCEHTQSSLPKI
jgi:hypothetical protein